jgi:hypothetical protein
LLVVMAPDEGRRFLGVAWTDDEVTAVIGSVVSVGTCGNLDCRDGLGAGTCVRGRDVFACVLGVGGTAVVVVVVGMGIVGGGTAVCLGRRGGCGTLSVLLSASMRSVMWPPDLLVVLVAGCGCDGGAGTGTEAAIFGVGLGASLLLGGDLAALEDDLAALKDSAAGFSFVLARRRPLLSCFSGSAFSGAVCRVARRVGTSVVVVVGAASS